jgi:hypothetical protein
MTDDAPDAEHVREKRDKPRPDLIPQAHGGALYRGGVPGNRGGWKPPSAIRARLRDSLDDRVTVLEEIADDPAMAASDRIRAVDVIAKYGLGAASEVTVDQVRERLAQTVALVREALPAEMADPLLRRMQEVWA